LAQDQ